MTKRRSDRSSGGESQPPGARAQHRRHPSTIYLLVLTFSLLAALALLTVRFRISGDHDGIYLLRGGKGFLLELRDSIFLGEQERVLFHLEYETILAFFGKEAPSPPEGPHLKSRWRNRTGRGFIRGFFPDKTEFVACFGRFLDSSNMAPHGLFLGGGLPFEEYEHDVMLEDKTGMAFFDGAHWQHLWCSANESIGPGSNTELTYPPATWKYLGGKVIRNTREEVLLASAHEVSLEGRRVRIERFVLHRAGDRYIVLVLKIANVDSGVASYQYIYGDEPWVGDFGTSLGNVGWYRDGLVQVEGTLSPSFYRYAGYWDHGNSLCSPTQTFSEVANFIEWGGDFPPDLVYFSNVIGGFSGASGQVPLCSESNRVLFLQYAPRNLPPGQTDLIWFAIGMADPATPESGLPVKPQVSFNPEDYPILRHEAARAFDPE